MESPSALDNYTLLGRSGLRVSPMCLGAMTFGEKWVSNLLSRVLPSSPGFAP